MYLSFLPAELFLTKKDDGAFVVSMKAEEVFRTKSLKKALAKFNELRRELDAQFPIHEFTAEEKTELRQKHINEAIAGQTTHRPRKKLKRGSTRTFG